MSAFLSTKLGMFAIAALAGAALAAVAYFSKRFSSLPAVEKFKQDYPVVNYALKIASDNLKGTPYDAVFRVALALYEGKGLSVEEATRYATAMNKSFDFDKYLGTDFEGLDSGLVQQGYEIASKAFPSLSGSSPDLEAA